MGSIFFGAKVFMGISPSSGNAQLRLYSVVQPVLQFDYRVVG